MRRSYLDDLLQYCEGVEVGCTTFVNAFACNGIIMQVGEPSHFSLIKIKNKTLKTQIVKNHYSIYYNNIAWFQNRTIYGTNGELMYSIGTS